MADKTMLVRMKTSMSGHNFSIAFGDIVEQEVHIAKEWIRADIAEEYLGEVADKTLQGTITSLENQLKAAAEENEDLKKQIEEVTAKLEDATTQLEELQNQLKAAAEENETSKSAPETDQNITESTDKKQAKGSK